MNDSAYKWYVIFTKSQHEKKVFAFAENMGIEVYLPMLKTLRNWSDRKKIIDVPLFPNYIFLKVSNKEFFKVLEHPSVIRFLKIGDIYATLTAEQIHIVKTVEKGKNEFFFEKISLKKGLSVMVKSGPLRGLIGEVMNIEKKSCLLFLLEQVNKSTLVRIESGNIVCC